MNSKIVYRIDIFENGKTNEKVQGITIMVDGDFKKELDVIMGKEPKYKNYVEVINDAIFKGMKIIEDKIGD